jgi:hypothetical protein
MVQVATTLPMFLFAMPAGALADIRRPTEISDRGGSPLHHGGCDICGHRLVRCCDARQSLAVHLSHGCGGRADGSPSGSPSSHNWSLGRISAPRWLRGDDRGHLLTGVVRRRQRRL